MAEKPTSDPANLAPIKDRPHACHPCGYYGRRGDHPSHDIGPELTAKLGAGF